VGSTISRYSERSLLSRLGRIVSRVDYPSRYAVGQRIIRYMNIYISCSRVCSFYTSGRSYRPLLRSKGSRDHMRRIFGSSSRRWTRGYSQAGRVIG
jgi:hypothetical protein